MKNKITWNRKRILKTLIFSGVGSLTLTVIPLAQASVTEDLIDILVAKGVVSSQEANALRAKSQEEAKQKEAAIRQQIASEQKKTADKSIRAVVKEEVRKETRHTNVANLDQRVNAAVENSLKEKPFLRTLENGGVGFQAGDVKFQVSGNINTFSTFERVDNPSGITVAGGLVGARNNDTFAIRNGLLPNALVFDVSTVQKGYDIGVKVGLYPGTNNLDGRSVLNANGGGTSFSLGTAGIDARQAYLTIGNKQTGTFKLGRDIGIFGRNAILNDFSIFGLGTPLGNAAPANTSLGRIGLGYIYTDFQPQISYRSPSFNGFTFEGGIFQPYDAFAFAGALSGVATGGVAPQFQGQVEYNGKFGEVDSTLWAGLTTIGYRGEAAGEALAPDESQRGIAGEVGAKFTVGRFGLVASGYYGDGVGTTALGFDALSADGETRDSFGGYVQGTFKPRDDLTLALSYGASLLDTASGEVAPTLVEVNQSVIGSARYNFTKWVNFQGEVAYTQTENQIGDSIDSLAFTFGSILFF